ncbi:hypothetical protein [Neolewinella sp.]|uniref:hypothetical protein n=1 Tax=Neolewinella sp. TaxID=2993543 RepID=UPI003B51DBAC
MLRTLLLLLLAVPLLGQQDFKLAAAGKTVEFREIDQLTIIGGAGSELTVEGHSNRAEADERAAGLRRISASGLRDNTGFGISVTESEGRILVQQVSGDGKAVTVRVPNSATVRVEQSTYRGGDLEISDFSGELDVSMMYHSVKLRNVTGPMAVSAVYDDIVAVWDSPPTQEVRLHSSYSDVDVTLPAATKADVRLSSGYGNMYTDFDIQIKANTTASVPQEERRERGDNWNNGEDFRQNQLTGTINGGGPLLSLTATYDNLYIRKQ